MERIRITDPCITALKYDAEDDWLKSWAKEHGNTMSTHPLYLALKGDRFPLHKWCNFRGDIWLMERISLLLDVYRSLIRYGQIEPIEVKDGVIVTGHKRAACLMIMGKETIKAYET